MPSTDSDIVGHLVVRSAVRRWQETRVMERGRKNKIEGKVIPVKTGLQTDFGKIVCLEKKMSICAKIAKNCPF